MDVGEEGGGVVEEQSTPVSACREEEGEEEEGEEEGEEEEEEGEEGLGAFQKQGTLRVQVEASGTRKRLSGRFHFFLEAKINE